MRSSRLVVVLAITAGLSAPRGAAAFCEAPGPYLGTGPQLQLGCPVHVYHSVIGPPMMDPLTITAVRNGTYVNVGGSPVSDLKSLAVEETFIDCQHRVTSTSTDYQSYEHLAIPLVGVAVGERVGVGAGWLGGIEIVPAAPCFPALEPRVQCTFVQQPCGGPPQFEDVQVSGCAAGAAGGLWIGLALLGLRRRRR